jgi:hypothetical protein
VKKADRSIRKNHKRNLVAAWFNVCRMLKDKRKRTEECEINIDDMKRKLAINRWRNRKDATLRMRNKAKQMKEQL